MPVDESSLLGGLAAFVRRLRAVDLPIGMGQALAFYRAAALLDPTDTDDLYWAGRTQLVSSQSEIPTFDLAFRDFFLDHEPIVLDEVPAGEQVGEPVRTLGQPSPSAPVDNDSDVVGTAASDVEVLRTKRFAEYEDEDVAALRRAVAEFRLHPPMRRTRRTRSSPRGRAVDLRHTVRRAMRSHGEIVRVDRRIRRVRPRRIVLLLDVSGSMAPYSRALLQFAHATTRGTARVETFCFGTRLTRLTEVVRRRDPDEALAEAALLVSDWDGGTRIGACLRTFLRDWGRQGTARGAVVIICSDGLDCGEPDHLAAQMERLGRLAHRIVWVNPLKGDQRYEARARGMAAALPYVDEFVPGHDLASLQALAGLVARAR